MKWVNRYKLLVEEASEGIIIINKNLFIIDANECALKISGYSIRELKKLHINELLAEDEVKTTFCFKSLYNSGSCLLQTKLKRKNHEILDAEITAKKFKDGDAVIFLRDITERIKVNESMWNHNFLLNNLKDAIISTDENLVIKMWNKGAEDLYEWQAGEVIGKKITDIVRINYNKICKEEVDKKLHEEGRWVGEAMHVTKSGKQKNIFSSVEIIKSADGSRKGLIAINIDISEKIEFQNKLRQNYLHLKKIAWLQAHEVRAPLTNILSIVQLLEAEKNTPEENSQLIQFLKTSAQKLDATIRKVIAITITGKKEIGITE